MDTELEALTAKLCVPSFVLYWLVLFHKMD